MDKEKILIVPEKDLSSPWYILRNKFLYTIGRSPFIVVNDLKKEGSNYLLQFNVSNINIALALREIIEYEYNFNNRNVITKVVGPNNSTVTYIPDISYTPEEVVCNICWALYKNPLFIGNILDVISEEFSVIGVILKKRVVQFSSDNLLDYCSSYLEVASKVFESLLKTSYKFGKNVTKVYYTTENKRCLEGKVYYCC